MDWHSLGYDGHCINVEANSTFSAAFRASSCASYSFLVSLSSTMAQDPENPEADAVVAAVQAKEDDVEENNAVAANAAPPVALG